MAKKSMIIKSKAPTKPHIFSPHKKRRLYHTNICAPKRSIDIVQTPLSEYLIYTKFIN